MVNSHGTRGAGWPHLHLRVLDGVVLNKGNLCQANAGASVIGTLVVRLFRVASVSHCNYRQLKPLGYTMVKLKGPICSNRQMG
jgi:hypothetical protein